jgi:hypothetical protein
MSAATPVSEPGATGTAVTAVVLTMGEETTGRAVESVRRQTHAVADVVLVEGVRPFHRALNAGAAQVKTPFFVQVDADMVLDGDCVERLVALAAEHVGIVLGYLRDPMFGRVQGVKLFRTACFAQGGMPDTISPDTDFGATLAARGWVTLFALRDPGTARELWHTFGEHRPTYDPRYTYAKFCLEGRRRRYRGDAGALRRDLARLARSPHPTALLAEIALANGLFLDGDLDLLTHHAGDGNFERLSDFLGASGAGSRAGRGGARSLLLRWAFTAETAFRRSYRLGLALGRGGDRATFERTLRRAHAEPQAFDWITQVGLCRGLLADRYDPTALATDWSRIAGLYGSSARRPPWRRFAARLRRAVRPDPRTHARLG